MYDELVSIYLSDDDYILLVQNYISVKYYLSILNYHENKVYSVLKCKYISI